MTDMEQRKAAKEFVAFWKGKGYEKGESQPFWFSLLHDVFGVEHPEQFIEFENQVHLDHTSFIDGYIPATKVLIEQKGLGKDLMKPIKQSDGSRLTPFQQAKRYITELPLSRHPRWVVTCNFAEFHVYDMEQPGGEPEQILLDDLEKDYYRLSFLTDTGSEQIRREMEVSIKAGEVVGLLYDAFLKQYPDQDNPKTLKSLNKLCVRLVFCLYAEDAGVFGRHNMFHDYMSQFSTQGMRKGLVNLFKVLDQKPEERDTFLADDDALLAAFPYVNGGLFADEGLVIPPFTEEIRDLLLTQASADFDWSEISPTIFGAVFESTLNPETRRSGGMHYTSVENIHKVIDPLFLDDLKQELADCKSKPLAGGARTKALSAFQEKLASLRFLDPACGSGNFLTETYLSLRKLENEVVRDATDQITIGAVIDPIKVSIDQFYGIEINDFAVTVAKTALWIAENQMMKQTEDIIHANLDFLPLTTNAYIVEGNALHIDWESVVPKDKLNYIMGNPPFVGEAKKSVEQRADMQQIFGQGSSETKLDYVICWYKKAADYMKGSNIVCSFVSTNSICQGESVPTLWKNLVMQGISIVFAYRSFKWRSEASDVAQVYCVIIGFSYNCKKQKVIYTRGSKINASHINAYLLDADDIWLQSRKNKPLNGLAKMTKGSEPTDGGNLFLSPEEKDSLIARYPILEKYIRPFIGGKEFTSNKAGKFTRYCFWFKNGNPSDYIGIPEVHKRLMNIRDKRLSSSAERIRKMAAYPYLFCQERQPEQDYLLFPRHTTSERKYIPFGYISKDVIVGDSCTITESVSLYEFGLLISDVHMAWTKVVCGRLGNEYRYSQSVYNNFPLPKSTDVQRVKIEQTAQAILDARALYPDSSLADLYDELTMPPELRTAHQKNDAAVMEAYGFRKIGDDGKKHWLTESETVAELMKMYQTLTAE